MAHFRSNENDEQQPTLPPPVPIFRSVSMSVRPTPALQQQLQTTQHHQLRKSHSSPFHLITKSTENKNSDSPSWIWKLSQLAPVPLYHPLERSAISSTDSLNTITERISNFMKTHSIQCSYYDDLGRVDCSTDGLVHFVVQLWKKNNSTTIEIQRRQGCAISMQGIRQKLIQTILHGEEQQQPPKDAAPSDQACAFMRQLPVEQPKRSTGCLEHCLELCEQFLQSDHLDQNRLGLESLCVMTDTSKVMPQDAQETSRQVLQDATIQNLLIKYFTPDMDAMNYDKHMFGALHLLALKVLSHSLETIIHQHQQHSFSIDVSSTFWKAVLQVGTENIQLANERPIEASLSMRSLRLLYTMEPTALMHLQQQQQLSKCLQNAHEYGRQHNYSLQKETELLMMMPSGSVY